MMRVPQLVDIVFPLPLSQAYTYEVPDPFPPLHLGQRALVPFRNRMTTGFIINKTPLAPPGKLKSIIELIDHERILNESLIALLYHMQKRYGYRLGECLTVMLPPKLIHRSKRRIVRVPSPSPCPDISPALQPWLNFFAIDRPLDYAYFTKHHPDAKTPLRELEKLGLIKVESYLETGGAQQRIETHYHLPPHFRPLVRGPRQRALYDLLDKHAGTYSESQLKQTHPELLAAAKNLVKRGFLQTHTSLKMAAADSIFTHAPNHPLNPAQNQALNRIVESLAQEDTQAFLLFGATGSGKTEVYLRAAEATLAKGKTVLALVPEIALTPQFLGRFRARFGSQIAILHSGLSDSERLTEWLRILKGEASVVVGVRSAVFSPLENIGLIILDEEHDGSYKQSDGLRYDAKDLARFRAQYNKATLVLGSATPSLESFYSNQKNDLQLIELPERVGEAQLPQVDIIDLRGKVDPYGQKGLISESLREAIEETLMREEQAILFLNRRGFAPLVLCPKCGEHQRCPHCSVTLTYHRQEAVHRCHYCDFVEKSQAPCQNCGSSPLLHLGVGTQSVEEELSHYFPDARILRMDRDSTRRKDAHQQLLEKLSRHEVDILIGTQMISKGIDFESVTLVGVLLADQSLHFPDFRAAETTFQLLTQVVGRAGRGHKKGRAILQSFQPQHYAIETAARQDYQAFYQQEIAFREGLDYPPFCHLALFEITGKNKAKCLDSGRWLKTTLQRFCGDGDDFAVLGPAPAPIEKIKDDFRFHLLIKAKREHQLSQACLWAFEPAREALKKQHVKLTLDLNPRSFL